MLHSRTQRQNLNQENPTAPHRPVHPTKTPLRQQQQQSAPLKGLLTGGKGLIGVKTPGRVGGVLAQRDGNQGKGSDAPRLSFEKPNASASGSCNTVLQTPRPTSRALHLLQTPAPHIARQLAPLSPEPEVEEVEEEEPESAYPNFDYNQEVEFSGKSALEYEEPFESDFPEVDFDLSKSGFGDLLRNMPLMATESYADWDQRDEIERLNTKFELDIEPYVEPIDEGPKLMFPVPKRRIPLAPKPLNQAVSSASRPLTSKVNFPLRSSVGPSALGFPTSSIKSRTPLLAKKPQWGASPTATSSPLAHKARSPFPSSIPSRLTSSSSMASPSVSSSSLRTKSTTPLRIASSRSSNQSAISAASLAASKAEEYRLLQEEEAALGIFGIVDGQGLMFEDESFDLDEGFNLDLLSDEEESIDALED